MAVKSTLKRTGSGLGAIEKNIARLVRTSVLVGIPAGSTRQPEAGEKGTPPSNGLIGYIQEFGDDAHRIPPRPFLRPGVRAALPDVRKGLRKAAEAALSRKTGDIAKGFDEAGLVAVASVQQTMVDGGFVPLAQSTIEARARRRNPETGKLKQDGRSRDARSFLELQGQGTPDHILHDAGFAKPLIDTGSLFRSITHIVREK